MASSGWKKWTDEETELLREWWGTVSYKELAKRFNRSVLSVTNRANYIGLGASCDADKFLTFRTVYNALYGYNPSVKGEQRLFKKGFPVKVKIFCKKRYKLVEPDALWEWLKNHKDEFDFTRFSEYALGPEPDWVKEKRKSDWRQKNMQRWSE